MCQKNKFNYNPLFLLLSFSFLFKKEAKQNPLFWSWCFIFIHSSSNLWSSVLRNLRSAFIKIFKAHQHIASIYINIYKSRRIIGTRERERSKGRKKLHNHLCLWRNKNHLNLHIKVNSYKVHLFSSISLLIWKMLLICYILSTLNILEFIKFL
jgi:hypothetical protein